MALATLARLLRIGPGRLTPNFPASLAKLA
jgi:hypothetical protein